MRQKSAGKGTRFIICHIAGKNGFVPGAGLVFHERNVVFEDYHKSMTADLYEKWIKGLVTGADRKIPPNSVIVMDNAPYHSRKEFPTPCMGWKKESFIQFILDHSPEGRIPPRDVLKKFFSSVYTGPLSPNGLK